MLFMKNIPKKYFEYSNRKQLLQRAIPKLNCLWADVIFLLPLNPYHVFVVLTSLGISVKHNVMFYKIPIQRLNDNINAIYFYDKEHYQGPTAPIPNEEIELISLKEYVELDSIPIDTIMYFKKEHEKGRNFGMFAYIPHILTLGNINLSNLEVVNWSSKP
ncbi:group-specific protein [Viridibacillus soli]|uniref:group-specific protein n=1 Tax=Viridibacillus soli TaxID=2798301 RepID=UPI001F36EF3B|nr:group-specific protein [Viridibacillus soli]